MNATGSRGRIGGGGYGRCLPGGRHEGRARQFELRGLWGGGTLREQFARQAS